MLKYLTIFGCDVKSLWELIVAKTHMSHSESFFITKETVICKTSRHACICHDMCGGHVIGYDLIHYVMAKPTKWVLSSVREGHSNQLVNLKESSSNNVGL